ncbi:MAG: hypothetical protein K2O31_01420 [Clostridia bacterium]|nr:hypothetical protein [Clostridia bacterium]
MKIFLHNRKDIKVFQDAKPLKIYCQNGKEYVLPQVDDNGYFQVEFIKKSEFSGALWLFRALFFWIIGIMGFFTPRYSKCNHSLDCQISGIDCGMPLNVSFIHPNSKYGAGVGVKLREEGFNVDGAEYIVDNKAQKRKKLYSFLSSVLRLALIALIIVVIIKAMIG